MGFQKKTGKNRLDKYYHLAKDQGYRSRASFKLIQLNQKYDFLSKARILLDLCAAPGSWLQVASKYMPVSRICIGVDLVPIKPIPHCTMLQQDITTAECRQEIRKVIGDEECDVVLHDGAPNMGKSWVQDAYTQSELVLASLKLSTLFLKKGGVFVSKVFRSADYNNLMWVFNHFFKKVTATKPTASRAVSAEIFVVCEGYLKPEKIDPKLLDPRFVFKDIQEEKKPVDIFTSTKRLAKRQRGGYDTDSMILFTRGSVLEFIESADPVKVLASYNQLSFDKVNPDDDTEELNMFKKHPLTTEEVKACLDDLKVLNHKDFKGLLKWRQKMREFGQMGQFAPKEEKKEEEIVLTDEQKQNLLQQEIEDALNAKARRKKKKDLKKVKQAQRYQMRMGLNTNMENEEFEAPEEVGLFSLKAVSSNSALEALTRVKEPLDLPGGSAHLDVNVDGMDEDFGVLEALDQEEKDEADRIKKARKQIIVPEDGSDVDSEDARTNVDEHYLDMMYTQFIKDTEDYKKKNAKQSRIDKKKLGRNVVELPAELTSFDNYIKAKKKENPGDSDEDGSDDEGSEGGDDEFDSDPDLDEAYAGHSAHGAGGSDDEGNDPNRNELLRAPDQNKADVSKRAARWFSQKIFQGLDDELDSDDEAPPQGMKRARDEEPKAEAAKKSAAKKGDSIETGEGRKGNGKSNGKSVRFADESAKKGEDEGEEEEDLPPKKKQKLNKKNGDEEDDGEEFEVVPAEPEKRSEESSYSSEGSDEDDEDSLDPDDFDDEERAEMLAIGAKLKNPKSRSQVIDESINRYQFQDTKSLPTWFVDDEGRHNQPQKPVTKEEVDDFKMQLKGIDARSTKKVAEAAARKRKKSMIKLEKAKATAKNIASNEEMGEKDKIRAIQKLYKGSLGKLKPNKVYVIGGHVADKKAMSSGKNQRIKLVDPRLKKDKRSMKRVEKAKRKNGGRRK